MILELSGSSSYTHDDNELSVAVHKRDIYSRTLRHYLTRERWIVKGRLLETSQSALTTACNNLEAAYAVPGFDITLKDNLSAATTHTLQSSGTIGGIRKTDIKWHDSVGVEYVNRRTYTIVLEADIFKTSSNVILLWQESLRRIGKGGNKVVWKHAITGPAQKQIVREDTTFVVIQSGRSVALNSYVPATSLWPDDEHSDKSVIEYHTPTWAGSGAHSYPVSWRFIHERGLEFGENPTAIPS